MPINQTKKTFIGSLSSRAHFGDEKAKEVLEKLRTINEETDFFGGKLGKHRFLQAKERTEIFDMWVKTWINENPNGTILNVGCGFCTRFWRLDNGTINWIDVDYPDMIELRHKVLPIEDLNRCQYIGHDLIDPLKIDRGLLIGEGVFPHMEKKYVRQHLKGECMFDVQGQNRTVGLGNFKWRYVPEEWKFKIIDKQIFDVTMNTREAWALWIKE